VLSWCFTIHSLQEKRKEDPMNGTAPSTAARSTLPLLVNLVMTRKQARWQWAHCAGEHKHVWSLIIAILDERIELGEKYLSELLDVPGFRVKREVVE